MTHPSTPNPPVPGRVVTLTFSPALDVSTETDTVVPTRKLRCAELVEHPGGGGVNVARVAARLGASTRAVVPLGGRTGSRVAELLHDEHIELAVIEAASPTRQSFSVTGRDSGEQYRFVMPAPPLSPGELDALIDATGQACENAGRTSGLRASPSAANFSRISARCSRPNRPTSRRSEASLKT